MHSITYSLAPMGEPSTPQKPALAKLQRAADYCKTCVARMSTETKQTIERWVAIIGLLLAILVGLKTYIFMPSDIDGLKEKQTDQGRALYELQAKASSDRELLITLKVQNEIMQRDITEIKQAVRGQPSR